MSETLVSVMLELAQANIEITRLHSERDEALAQVAALLQACHGHHTHMYDQLKDCPICQQLNIPTEARALLDRFQRAEAVVRIVKRLPYAATVAINSDFHVEMPNAIWGELITALAAWEEKE